jgi:hypothetical protein
MITADRSKEFLVLNRKPKTYHASSVVKSAFIRVKGVRWPKAEFPKCTDPFIFDTEDPEKGYDNSG